MYATKRIRGWAIIIILLLLANLGWIWWNVSCNSGLCAAGKQFKIEMLHTNGVSGIGIFEGKTEQPLWIEWDFNSDGKAKQENYFFQGKDVFDVTLSSNHAPKYSVYFRGPGKSATWWIDDWGNGSFTDRIYYDTNGNFYNREVWYKEAWNTVDRRNERNGIVINGQWHQLALDTNGLWTTKGNQ